MVIYIAMFLYYVIREQMSICVYMYLLKSTYYILLLLLTISTRSPPNLNFTVRNMVRFNIRAKCRVWVRVKDGVRVRVRVVLRVKAIDSDGPAPS